MRRDIPLFRSVADFSEIVQGFVVFFENYIFCYHSVITNGCQDTLPAIVFLYCSSLRISLFYILHSTEKPVEPNFYGYLTFGHNANNANSDDPA